MAIRSISVLKSYFNTGDKPDEQQFADLIDSFFHKNLGIPISSIVDLSTILSNKVDKEAGKGLSSNDLTNALLSQINSIDGKVDKEVGKVLSTNDFTNSLLMKLNGLENYQKPVSEEIAYISGLQLALNSKLNISEAVLSVNNITPDSNGNISIEIDSSYNLTNDPIAHNYKFFGKQVYVVLVPMSIGVIDNVNDTINIAHDLSVGDYVKIEVRTPNGVVRDLDPDSFIDFDPLSLTLENFGFEADKDSIYIEYTLQVEGISVDAIGVAAIGNQS